MKRNFLAQSVEKATSKEKVLERIAYVNDNPAHAREELYGINLNKGWEFLGMESLRELAKKCLKIGESVAY